MNLLELRAQGHGYREIAKLSGASRNTVRKWYILRNQDKYISAIGGINQAKVLP